MMNAYRFWARLSCALYPTIFLDDIRHSNMNQLDVHFDKADLNTKGKQNVFVD